MKKKIIKFTFNSNPIKKKPNTEGKMAKKKVVKRKAKRSAKQIAATKKMLAARKRSLSGKKKTVKRKSNPTKPKRSPKQIAATKKMVAARKKKLAIQKKTYTLLKKEAAKGGKKKAKKKVVKRKSTSLGSTASVAKKLKKRDTKKETRKKRVKTRNNMKRGSMSVQTWKGQGRKKGKKHVKWDKMLVTKRTNPMKKTKYKKRKNPMGGKMGKLGTTVQKLTQHNVSEMGGLFAGGVVHQFSNDMVTKFAPKLSAQMEGKLGAFAGSVTPIILGALLSKFGGKNNAVKSVAKGLVGSGIVGLGLATYETVAPAPMVDMSGYEADLQVQGYDEESMGALETEDFGALETEDFGALETDDFGGEYSDDYYDTEMGTES